MKQILRKKTCLTTYGVLINYDATTTKGENNLPCNLYSQIYEEKGMGTLPPEPKNSDSLQGFKRVIKAYK